MFELIPEDYKLNIRYMFATNEVWNSSTENGYLPLKNLKIVSLACNLPGPLAASHLQALGAEVVKIEPPGGDPFNRYCSAWYQQLIKGQRLINLDLKNNEDREKLNELLAHSDMLITSMRLAALERLNLSRDVLRKYFPRLLQIAILGYQSNLENIPGHDLTYQASLGLLSPPQMPKTLLTDIAAAERVVTAALGLVLAREKGLSSNYLEVSIAEAGDAFAAPFRFGLTASKGILGGDFAGYNLYQTAQGWIALATLEPRFQGKLLAEFELSEACQERLQRIFLTKTAAEWEDWAHLRDLPIKAVVGT